jgi:hypothetical protein
MQSPHPITLWRRKTGRIKNPRGGADAVFLNLAAVLLEARRHRDGLDYRAIKKEKWKRLQDPDVIEIRKELSTSRFPAGMIAVASCDLYKIGTRSRRRRPVCFTKLQVDSKKIAKILKHEYPMLTKEQIDQLLKEELGKDWLDEYNRTHDSRDPGGSVSIRQECPSKIFPQLSRPMISHWRHHRRFQDCMAQLRIIAFAGQNPPSFMTQPPSRPRFLVASA